MVVPGVGRVDVRGQMGFAGLGYDLWALVLGFGAGFACGFLNTAASSGSAVSLPVLMMIGLDPVSANGTNRIPVLIGALSATWSFHQKKARLWALALKVSLPVAIGGLIGAGIAEILLGRDLALVITAAVLVALVLLFTKLKHAIEQATAKDVQYGAREFAVFVAIGVWLGFIVLDGATYIAARPNAGRRPAAGERQCHQERGAGADHPRGDGRIRLSGRHQLDHRCGHGCRKHRRRRAWRTSATSPAGRKWVFRLLVIVICAELVHLTTHYVFTTV